MISFAKALALLESKKITTYKIRKEKLFSESTMTKLRNTAKGIPENITTDNINTLCRLLDCQPGDLMEYTPDSE